MQEVKCSDSPLSSVRLFDSYSFLQTALNFILIIGCTYLAIALRESNAMREDMKSRWEMDVQAWEKKEIDFEKSMNANANQIEMSEIRYGRNTEEIMDQILGLLKDGMKTLFDQVLKPIIKKKAEKMGEKFGTNFQKLFKMIRFGPIADFKETIYTQIMDMIQKELPDMVLAKLESLVFTEILGALGISDDEELQAYSAELLEACTEFDEFERRNLESDGMFPAEIITKIEDAFYAAIMANEKYWSGAMLKLLKDEFLLFITDSLDMVLEDNIFGKVKELFFKVVGKVKDSIVGIAGQIPGAGIAIGVLFEQLEGEFLKMVKKISDPIKQFLLDNIIVPVEDVAAMIMGGIQQHVTLPEGDMDELKEESDEKVKGNKTRITEEEQLDSSQDGSESESQEGVDFFMLDDAERDSMMSV